MERKNIPFQYGIHRTPSMANDGELSECINVEAHNGELTPSVIPEIAFTLQEGDKLLFVHTSGNYKNFIIQRGNLLCWFSDEDKETVTEIGDFKPTSIHSVGNTLVVLLENGLEYILYKEGKYKSIGSNPPFCSISFGLQPKKTGNTSGELVSVDFIRGLDSEDRNDKYGEELINEMKEYVGGETTTFNFNLKDLYTAIEYDPELEEDTAKYQFAREMVNEMTRNLHALLNSNDSVRKKHGLFGNSFFLRYAYRMYDGSYYMHSSPIFFPLCTKGPAPQVTFPITTSYSMGDYLSVYVRNLSMYLDYNIVGFYNNGKEVNAETLNDWSDIIKGLDIFVTKEIQNYNSDSKIFGFSTTSEFSDSILYCGKGSDGRGAIFPSTEYRYASYNESLFAKDKSKIMADFDLIEDESFVDKIKDSSVFYKIFSFDKVDTLISESLEERKILQIKENVLSTLEQQEKLDDDYDSHNKIIPSFAHVYNGRLNIAGIRTKLFDGYPMESMVPYTYLEEGDNYTWTVRTCMEIDGKEVEVVSKSNIKLHEKPAFIYYPSTKGYKFKVYMYNDFKDESGIINLTAYSAEFKSEVHKLLNGAFYLSPSYGLDDVYELDITAMNPVPVGDPYISYPNKIYTSEVNNPFFFPLSGRNSIGTGDIIAISSNTKAISPGQFGQYPMIVFSTDGVWAMQVAGDGLYQSIHPISKDICVNPNVLQTNGPILFATDNGLYSVISESVEHISKIMKGAPDIIDIPTVGNEYTFLMESAKSDMSFNTYIKEAIFAHDYINNRVVIYNPKMDFAYIYCMDCGMFAKMVIQKEGVPTRIESVVKAYPEVYMQSGADIYTFVHDRDDMTTTPSKGIIVTRPMSFSDPLAMKVINIIKLIYRKRTEDTRCRYALFVSNDGNKWSVIPSLRGRSFKYFRFAVYTELADTDALVAMSVMFDYRRTNKLR